MKPLGALAFCFVFWGLAAPAADFSDPTWPCIQRKVERLSVGLMWPVPINPLEMNGETAQAVDDLAKTLILRRVDLDRAQALIRDFVQTQSADPALMGQVFAQVFAGLDTRRTALIRGIEDYSLKQIGLSERIDETRGKMDALMTAPEPDFDQVDALEEQLAWDERIYTDRQRSLTYVCETPVLLEKRLYAIAEMLMDAAE